jgi:polyhydroxyalkanoate synthase
MTGGLSPAALALAYWDWAAAHLALSPGKQIESATWSLRAPWRSAFKIHLLADTAVTFLLTTGGHNAGIVSGPDRPDRTFRILRKRARDRYLDPDVGLARAQRKNGSWWPEWVAWLEARSGAPETPPTIGASEAGYPLLHPAPGTYVLGR